MGTVDPDVVREMTNALRVLVGLDQVFEARLLKVKPNGERLRSTTWAGFYDYKHIEKAAVDIAMFDGRANTYITPNPVNPRLLARHTNKLVPIFGKDDTGSARDVDIIRWRWLFIDVDPVRPEGISSTDEEHDLALATARDIRDFLVKQGWPQVILADSGNGGHVLPRVDLPATDETREIVAAVLAELERRFSTDRVKVDQACKNPSRLWKLYGAKAVKGDDAPELGMPHRRAKILDLPERVDPVPVELLRELIGTVPVDSTDSTTKPATKPTPAKKKAGKVFDLERFVTAFLEPAGLIISGKESYRGGIKWRMNCAFVPEHLGSAYVCQLENGALDYRCAHDTCKDTYTWADLRALYDSDGRDEVEIRDHLPEMVDRAEAAIADPDAPFIFNRCKGLVRLTADPGATIPELLRPVDLPAFTPAEVAWLREVVSARLRFYKMSKSKDGQDVRKYQFPPATVLTAMAERREWKMIPTVEALAPVPYVTRDGRVVSRDGYDRSTGILANFIISGVEVPANPTRDDAVEALDVLRDPFREFPFVTPEDESVALAGVLSLLGRHAYAGVTPFFLARAPQVGAGKGLLISCIVIIGTGSDVAAFPPPVDSEENRKLLTAILLTGIPAISFDNIADRFGNVVMAKLLTDPIWNDRVLGENRSVSVPVRSVFFGTGRNVVLVKDLPRRTLTIDLDANVENAEERTFDVADLRADVKARRPELVSAGLTMLAAYINAGKPEHGRTTFGSFEGWDGLVRGCLIWAGAADPCGVRERIRQESDQERDQLGPVLTAWDDLWGDTPKKTADVVEAINSAQPGTKEAALKTALEGWAANDKAKVTPSSLGARLRSRKGVIVEGRKFVAIRNTTNTSEWVVAHAR